MRTSNFTWNFDDEELQSESVKVIQWHGFFSIILICLCSAFAIISTAGKSMIIYFILYKAPKRPMNTMILLDQIGTLFTSLVTKFMTINSLIMATSILDLYGPSACEVYWAFLLAHNTLVATGGFTMALFRMLCVQFQSYIPSLEKLMVKLIWMQCALSIGVWNFSWIAADIYGSNNTFEFCRGYTTKMAHVLMKQSEEQKENGKHLLHSSILFCQAFVILEFVFYVVLFFSLREKNKSFFKIVQQDVLEKRAKKNTITFTGQAITFIVEVTYIILMQLLIQFGKVGGFFEPGILPCCMMAAMAIITSSQILASPELRRFIQGYD